MTAKNKPASCRTSQQSNLARVPFNGAGDGNRTRTSSLEGYSSTIELLPPGDLANCPNQRKRNKNIGGGRWITPGILPSAPPGPALRGVRTRSRESVEPAFFFRWFSSTSIER